MALRALSANNFLSRFLFLDVVVGCCNFFVEDERGVLDGEFVTANCLELFEDFLDLDLLWLRVPSLAAPLLFCASLCLDLLRERPTDDPEDSLCRTLLAVLRFGLTLLLLDLVRPSPSPSSSLPLLVVLALPLLLCRLGGGGGGVIRLWLLCSRTDFDVGMIFSSLVYSTGDDLAQSQQGG